MNSYTTIDEYIAQFPDNVQTILEKIRLTIRKAAPEAKEKIGYGIPTFTYHGNLVHFGGYAAHVSFYPGPGAIDAFQGELKNYKTSKGTIQFQLDQEIPYDLIRRITEFRVSNQTPKKK